MCVRQYVCVSECVYMYIFMSVCVSTKVYQMNMKAFTIKLTRLLHLDSVMLIIKFPRRFTYPYEGLFQDIKLRSNSTWQQGNSESAVTQIANQSRVETFNLKRTKGPIIS